MTKKITHTVMLILLFISVCSCQKIKIDAKDIVGKWEVINFEAKSLDLSPSLIEQGRKLALSYTYLLNDNNEYQLESNLENIKGTWFFNSIDQTIQMNFSDKYQEDGKEEYVITEFDDNSMTWKMVYKDLGYTIMQLSRK